MFVIHMAHALEEYVTILGVILILTGCPSDIWTSEVFWRFWRKMKIMMVVWIVPYVVSFQMVLNTVYIADKTTIPVHANLYRIYGNLKLGEKKSGGS